MPLPGLLLSIQAKTDYKNHFWFLFGPTDDAGRLTIAWPDLVKRADETANFAIMDYGRFANSFTGELIFFLADEGRLSRALKAFQEYRNYFSYPEGYAESLQNAIAVLGRTDHSEVSFAATATPAENDLKLNVEPPLVRQ